VHGANRLGGNSLLETLVFGKRAGDRAVEVARGTDPSAGRESLGEVLRSRMSSIEELVARTGGERQAVIRRDMQRTMTDHVGVYRDGDGVGKAVRALLELRERYRRVTVDATVRALNYDLIDALELGGMLDLAYVTALGAHLREECRGSHWRTDHLGRNDADWMRHTMATAGADGLPVIDYEDVIVTSYEPMERNY
jgi:succinate dehydrogenase / fumarate reductase flavoprotein subunit